MDEKVVVHTEIPKYLPKFENPIYRKALEEKKKKLRAEVISRIENKEFENGLFKLISTIDKLSYDEKNHILATWDFNGFQELIFFYKFPLLLDNLEGIKNSDIFYLEYKKRKEEGKGRG